MMYHACCGWSGEEADLEKEYVDGFLVAIVCPKCKANSPWALYEDEANAADSPDVPEYIPRNRDKNKETVSKRLRMWS